MDIDALLESEDYFKTSFGDISFSWRLLTLKEFNKFIKIKEMGLLEEHHLHSLVFDRCYIGNPDFINGNIPAGMTVSIGATILWLSGESQKVSLIEDIAAIRSQYKPNSMIEYMKRVIYVAFPAYKEEDLQDWNYLDLLRRFTVAEYLLIDQGKGYQPVDLNKLAQENSGKKIPGVRRADEFDKENKELKKALGDDRHPLDMAPDELNRKRVKYDMQKKIAERLSNRR